MSARHPYIGGMPPLPPTPHHPQQDIKPNYHDSSEDARLDDDEGELIIETPPRSPKGKERDIIEPDSASSSPLISPKNEPQLKPVEAYPVRNRIVNKAIKAEKTLLADKYNENGGQNEYAALVDRVALEHALLHKRRARGENVGKHEWMENARGFAQILGMMTEQGRWTYEVVVGADNAAKRYVVPTNVSNLVQYVPPIAHKVVTGICAAVGGAVAANISLTATGVLLVVTGVGVYMIATWNAGAQSEAVAGQLQDGSPITPEVSSKQVIRFVPKKGDAGEYERKAVPLRSPVAVKKELVALHAVANEIAKADGPSQAIALLNERINARERRILDLYARKTDWKSMLSPATRIGRRQLKARIESVRLQIEVMKTLIDQAQAETEKLRSQAETEKLQTRHRRKALTDSTGSRGPEDDLKEVLEYNEDMRRQKQDLELMVNLDQRELELIERTARHQCMAPNEIEEIANREDDISMMRGLLERLPDTDELGSKDAAIAFLRTRIAECEDDLKVAKVMEQINYMPYQSRGRGERAGFNMVVSAVGIGNAGLDAGKASATQQATSLPIAVTTNQTDLAPQPGPQPQPDLQLEPEPSPEPGRLADEFSPDWTMFGVNLGTAALQIAQVVRYATNQKTQAGKDQLLKWGAQCEVLAETAAGDLWTKANNPASSIDLKRLDDLKRGWLKVRYGHMSEILEFDANVTLMFLFKDLADGDAGPVKVSPAGVRSLDYKDVFLEAGDLMHAFKDCATAGQREELLVQLLTGKAVLEEQLKTPDALVDIDDVELTDEQASLLKAYTDLIKLSTEVKNGNVDAFFASELIEEEAKQNFENALRHAILNNTHEGLAGFLTMVTPEEKKQYSQANDWLAHVKGRVEKESMDNYYQLVQKRVQQHTHGIFGAASPQLTRSLGTLVAVVLRERGYDLAAASTLALLNSAAFVMSAVSIGMAFAYHRFIIAKNAERNMALRLGVQALPHTGSLKDGGYFSLPNLAYYTGEVTDFSRLVAKPLKDTKGVKVRYEQPLSPTAMVFKQLWSAAPLNKWRTEEGKFMCGLLHYYAGYFYKAGLDLELKEIPSPLTDEQVQDQLKIDLSKVLQDKRDSDVMSLHSPISVRPRTSMIEV